ncbi:synaptotagmin-7 isoform X3 [Vespula squamosa]|uniref:Synaptotagmin-7 isoform X3 n=1 Tax=Vespula squamosa TaxID=30214 RepID=A0ABD1ZWI7_VESSQ
MVHMGITGQYFAELEPNFDGSPTKAIDPAVRARTLVGIERRNMILITVFGTIGAIAVIVALGLAVWFYIRVRRSKQRNDDPEDPNEQGDGGTSSATQPRRKSGFLNLRTCFISTRTLGKVEAEDEGLQLRYWQFGSCCKNKESIDEGTLGNDGEVNQVVLNFHEEAKERKFGPKT